MGWGFGPLFYGPWRRFTESYLQWLFFIEAVWIERAAAGIEPGYPQGFPGAVIKPIGGNTAVSRCSGIFEVQPQRCGAGLCTPHERLAVNKVPKVGEAALPLGYAGAPFSLLCVVCLLSN